MPACFLRLAGLFVSARIYCLERWLCCAVGAEQGPEDSIPRAEYTEIISDRQRFPAATAPRVALLRE